MPLAGSIRVGLALPLVAALRSCLVVSSAQVDFITPLACAGLCLPLLQHFKNTLLVVERKPFLADKIWER